MWKMSVPLTADPGFYFTDPGLSTQTSNHTLIPLSSRSSSTTHTATAPAVSLQHIRPQLPKGPLVSFCPHRNDLTLVHWEDWFQNTSTQLAPADKAQENALSLRPDCSHSVSPSASHPLRKGMENPAAGNQSALYQHSPHCEQDKQVKMFPLVHIIFDTTL